MSTLLQPYHLNIPIPYKGAGNTIIQKNVAFDVFKDGEHFRVEPVLTTDELRIANLPAQMLFDYKDGKIISSRGAKDGNLHVLADIVEALKKDGAVV